MSKLTPIYIAEEYLDISLELVRHSYSKKVVYHNNPDLPLKLLALILYFEKYISSQVEKNLGYIIYAISQVPLHGRNCG